MLHERHHNKRCEQSHSQITSRFSRAEKFGPLHPNLLNRNSSYLNLNQALTLAAFDEVTSSYTTVQTEPNLYLIYTVETCARIRCPGDYELVV
jgi:hypothetical protein